MKKPDKTQKRLRLLARRAFRRARGRRRHREWRRQQNILNARRSIDYISHHRAILRQTGRLHRRNYRNVVAPKKFSFLENPKGIAAFIGDLKRLHSSSKEVFVVMREVDNIDYSAIVVLLSIMVKFKSSGISFDGDFPKNQGAKDILIGSGFFKYLRKSIIEEERYDLSKNHGIHTHAFKKVDPQLGAKIIEKSSATIWGEARRCQGVQRTILELMQNTNNHADIGRSGEKHWWLSVQHLEDQKKVVFSFVDYGVGIFHSLANKPVTDKFFGWMEKLSGLFSFKNNADILRLILEGSLHKTVTNEYFRGKGLPGIADALKRKQLSRLHIITNDVYANVEMGQFETMTQPFDGTFIYWELGEENVSCK